MPLQRMDGVYNAVVGESPVIIDLYQTTIRWMRMDGYVVGAFYITSYYITYFQMELTKSWPPVICTLR